MYPLAKPDLGAWSFWAECSEDVNHAIKQHPRAGLGRMVSLKPL
jgi:hypothetical protein